MHGKYITSSEAGIEVLNFDIFIIDFVTFVEGLSFSELLVVKVMALPAEDGNIGR